MRLLLYLLFSALFLAPAKAQTVFQTQQFKVSIDNNGRFSALTDIAQGVNYLSTDTSAAVLTVRSGNTVEMPATAKWNPSKHLLSLDYPKTGIRIALRIEAQNTHLHFEISSAEPAGRIDAVIWGPYPLRIGDTIGEIVGVVRNKDFAIGIQSLRPSTTGGLLLNSEGMVDGRGSAAWKARWGSTLQAFALNRAKPRTAAVWWGDFPEKPVTPLPGETVAGSAIALFGCPPAEVLDRIGAIELAEGLPHPLLDNVWVKKSPLPGQSYLISSFSESEVEEMIGATRRAGLISLYHEGPFRSWGHYDFNPDFFPDGKESIRRCAQKAHAAGLYFGVHTLTNFINTNDPYVSPVPDDRLVRTGSSTLVVPVDADDTEIVVADPSFFAPHEKNNLHTVCIGKELIRYRAVSETAPWKLLDCQRGAFGTIKNGHPAGTAVGKLMDHPYQIFFPEMALQNEIARNLAAIFNETGIDHLDFDGHEGGLACGQGDYGIDQFAKVFYDHIDHPLLNGTSNSKHYYWHINTYCNWGEPWYGGFRESMQEYRIRNQELFDRNYMPHMLGWYLMTATTSLSEMEWMLARAAAYDAGFAMVLSPENLRKNPNAGLLLDAIREWETARNKGAFPPALRERLKDPASEWHLEKISEGAWQLYPFHPAGIFTHAGSPKQPGEPVFSEFEFENAFHEQPLQFRLETKGDTGNVLRTQISLDQYNDLELIVELKPGEAVVCDGSSLLRIYDEKGRQRETVLLKQPVPVVGKGKHRIRISCSYKTAVHPEAVLHLKLCGAPIQLDKK